MIFHRILITMEKSLLKWGPGAHPTNDSSPKFAALWFETYSADHNEMLIAHVMIV